MKITISILLSFCLFKNIAAQPSRFFFRKLTVSDGLNDGGILAIAQDSRGFMWFSTKSGLNRFDGYSVKTYSHIAGDTASIPTSLSRCMSADSSGGFLIGLEDGLLEYDATTDRFSAVKSLDKIWINQIIPIDKNTIFLNTRKGLARYNPVTKTVHFYNTKQFNRLVLTIEKIRSSLLLGCNKGLYHFDTKTEQFKQLPCPVLDSVDVNMVTVDHENNYWVAIKKGTSVLKITPDLQRYESYNQYVESGQSTISNLTSILADCKGRIWITSQLNGLLFYNSKANRFDQFLHNPLQTWSISTNLHSSIYNDRDGNIWVGGNNGLNYFHPDKNLFTILPVFDKMIDIRNRRVARIAVEDKKGKLWFGTIDGVVQFDPSNNQYREWNNREGKKPMIHFNSVRGLICDEENNIWIATGKGINKYDQQRNQMIFYDSKDSIPAVFYFSADKDRNGNFWFSTRDGDGFYYYNTIEKKFHSIRSFPGVAVFAGNGGRKFFHDSRGRYWLGFNGTGAGMYDPSTGKNYHWQASTTNQPGIAGNSVVDIKEDKNGYIWISTFTGLTSIHPQSLQIKNYNQTNGLLNNSTGSLAVDKYNRLWIGTSGGLLMLDSNRTYFTYFGLQHGLPSIDFPEHASSLLTNGEIMMPTQNGFIRFNPAYYQKENISLLPYFTSFTVLGKQQPLPFQKIKLNYDENFFSIGFAAVRYDNPSGTWYAYKLEGIDKDWKYTQSRFVDYTNIPGGDYTFRVKASAEREEWNSAEIQLSIHIATKFYKTWWFRLLLLLASLSLFYIIYRYRIHQQQKVTGLKSKTQLLEKEKALVMYESLKQQLNPHFLFNSLTSLSGLIETDQKLAGNFLAQMSKIYRYILKNRDSELVSLKEELAFVQTYINLQRTRFKDGLLVKITIDGEELHKRIVPVTLQNLIENAIKHNIIDDESPLIIELTTENDYLLVKNNLQKKNMVETSNKQGLASLESLYKYLSDKPLLIEETKHTFTVRIPLI